MYSFVLLLTKTFNIMKNLKLLLVILVLFLISTSSFCKDVEIIKENGKRKLITFWKITYRNVHYDPCGGSCGEGLLECKFPGDETCAIPYSSGSSSVGKNFYSDELLNTICNEILDLVDQSIFKGKDHGNISMKVKAKTIDGKDMILGFSASWRGADIKTGDVKYLIKINELSI